MRVVLRNDFLRLFSFFPLFVLFTSLLVATCCEVFLQKVAIIVFYPDMFSAFSSRWVIFVYLLLFVVFAFIVCVHTYLVH